MGKFDSAIELMKKAQVFDVDIYDRKTQLDRFPAERKESEKKLEAEKQHLTELQEAHKKAQLAHKEKEGELSEKEAHIVKLDGQLSQVKTNKEYSAMQQEIASLKADNSLIEEDIIKLLDEIETAEGAVKAEEERLKQCEEEHKKVLASISERENQFKGDIEGLEKEREDVVNQLELDVKSLYERILTRKEGRVLARMTGEVCSACQMRLRPQVINEVMMGEGLVQCESCSRILYQEKEESAAPAE